MKIQISEKENKALERIAKSNDGKVLLTYVEKFLAVISDVRTMTEGETAASRTATVNLIEENLISKLKVLSGNLEEEDGEQDFL
jgi:hypothetical protein